MKLISKLIVAALLASPSLLFAQFQEDQVMSVRVPFPFTAQGIAMPAGRYDVSRTMPNGLWTLHTFGHVAVQVHVAGDELRHAAPSSALVFDHNADGYILRQIRQSGHADVALIMPPLNRHKSHLHEANSQPAANQTIAQSTTHTTVTAP